MRIGMMHPGTNNAITDVSGVCVGHVTLLSGSGPLVPGTGPVRTGVTVVLPHSGNLYEKKVRAAVHALNGFGKPFGFEEIRELGVIESPIALTSTLNVGTVADALVDHCIASNPRMGCSSSCVNVVVGEINDGFLNDIQGRHVKASHVREAIANAASGPVAEGSVGGGTGAGCFGWKGGIGTASRILPERFGGYTVGSLVQANLLGRPEDFVMGGVPVGKRFRPPDRSSPEQCGPGGSIVMLVATNAPLTSRQLRRLCVRTGAGLARTGTCYDHGSGDFAIAFTTAHPIISGTQDPLEKHAVLAREGEVMQGLFQAVAESIEDAIARSMLAAETMEGRDGNIRFGLPTAEVERYVTHITNLQQDF